MAAHRPIVFTNVPPLPSIQTATTLRGAYVPPFGDEVNVTLSVAPRRRRREPLPEPQPAATTAAAATPTTPAASTVEPEEPVGSIEPTMQAGKLGQQAINHALQRCNCKASG